MAMTERPETHIDVTDGAASIAVSLKRIADVLEYFARVEKHKQRVKQSRKFGGSTPEDYYVEDEPS